MWVITVLYYSVQTLECSFILGSDKISMLICKLASNSNTKWRAFTRLVKYFTSNSWTTISQHSATFFKVTVTAAYQQSVSTDNIILKSSPKSKLLG